MQVYSIRTASEQNEESLVAEFMDPQDEGRRVAQEISQLLLDGTSASSICVLLPRRKEMYQIIESAFQEFQIPYNSAVASDLSGSQAVIAVFDLLQAANSNFDREAVVRLLKSPSVRSSSLLPKQDIHGKRKDFIKRGARSKPRPFKNL